MHFLGKFSAFFLPSGSHFADSCGSGFTKLIFYVSWPPVPGVKERVCQRRLANPRLSNAQDVEAKAVLHRLIDQLVRHGVEPNLTAQLEAAHRLLPLLPIVQTAHYLLQSEI